MSKLKDLSGIKFGYLTVLERVFSNFKTRVIWKCICNCGNVVFVRRDNLISGNTKSCGCYKIKQVSIHGLCYSPTYLSWDKMIQRCTNPNQKGYNYYGGRGITVCDKWKNSFANFYKDMGDRPLNMSIERKDNNGNYTPDNCCWATAKQQRANRRDFIRPILNCFKRRIDGWKYFIFTTKTMKGNIMGNLVSITRGKSSPTLTRGEVKQGQVFAVLGRDGKYGTDYAAIGANGRNYSVNLKTGEVASTSNVASTVGLTGKWEFEINENPAMSVVRECRRSEVRAGEVFKVKGQSEQLYFHLGTISRAMNGFLSVPLARTENHAVTRNGNSRVQVVATGRIKATVSG